VSIYPSAAVNAITQVNDLSRPLSLVVSIEPNHNTDRANPTLKETVRDPNGEVIATNEFTKQFLTTIKPDVIGKYTLTIENQLNLNLFGGLVTGGILAIAGIIALIAGLMVVIVDRRRNSCYFQFVGGDSGNSQSSSDTVDTLTQS